MLARYNLVIGTVHLRQIRMQLYVMFSNQWEENLLDKRFCGEILPRNTG
jgi:hypothetical protein